MAQYLDFYARNRIWQKSLGRLLDLLVGCGLVFSVCLGRSLPFLTLLTAEAVLCVLWPRPCCLAPGLLAVGAQQALRRRKEA